MTNTTLAIAASVLLNATFIGSLTDVQYTPALSLAAKENNCLTGLMGLLATDTSAAS
jgi:hypothetical protein